MLRVEWKDDNGKYHTYYVSGTSVHRTIKRERRKLTEKYGTSIRYLAVERM